MDSSSRNSNTTEEWALELLAGFRFHPTDDQMVNLLKKKMEGKDSQMDHEPWEDFTGYSNQSISLFISFLKEMMQGKDSSQACHIIPEIDVCKFEPSDLPQRLFPDSPYKPRAWYSYSPSDFKYIHSRMCNRATEHGFWKSNGKPRRINSDSVTCFMRTLTFHEGRLSKSNKTSKKTDWVLHEFYFTEIEAYSYHNQRKRGFALCRLKNKAAKYNKSDNKELKDTSMCDEPSDPGTGGYITTNSKDDQLLACKELDRKADRKAVDDMIEEPEEGPDSSFPGPEPPQLENVPDVYNDRKSPVWNNDSYPADKNNISTNYGYEPARDIAHNYQDGSTYERSSEVESQWKDTLESLFHSFPPQNYTSQSPMSYSELGDFQHANNNIGCYGSQSHYPEIASLFPQSS